MSTKHVFVIILIGMASLKIQAADVEYSTGLEIATYENINLLNQSPGSEMSESVKGDLSIREDNADLDINFELEVEAIKFKNGQANDDTVTSLFLDCLVSITPSIFEWYTSGIYAQTPIDVLIGDVSLNRQDASAFSTGPNYHIRVNRSNMLTLESRIGSYKYEIENADNIRTSGAAIWALNINSALVFSLNSEVQFVDFENQIDYQNYNRYDYYLGLNYRRGINQLVIEVGQTDIESNNTDNEDELRFLFSAETSRTSVSRLRIELSHDVADTASQLESLIGEDFDFYDLTSTSSSLYVSEVMRMTYSKDLSSGNYSVQLNAESNKYVNQYEEDFDRYGIILRTEWFSRQDIAIMLDVRFYNIQQYNIIPKNEFNDYYYELGFRYSARRNLILNYGAIYQERDSVNIADTYEDMRFMISLTYTST